MNEALSLKNALSPAQASLLLKLFGELKIEIVSAVMWRGAGNWEIPERRLDHAFLILCIEGGFEGSAGDPAKKKKVGPGSGMLIPPGVPHAAVSGNDARNLAVHFRFLSPPGLPVRDFFPEYFFELAEEDTLGTNLETLAALAEGNQRMFSLWGESLLKTFFSALISGGRGFQLTYPRIDPRLGPSLKRIQESANENPGIKILAALAGLSEEQFRKLFRRDLGLSPKEYLIETKLTKAAELLLTTDLRVNEIGRRLGFAYAHYFHWRFKKRFGVSPKAYRQIPSI